MLFSFHGKQKEVCVTALTHFQRKANVACLAVVFPAVKPFFPEFCESLRRQTCHDFDLLLVNDGWDIPANMMDLLQDIHVIEIPAVGSPTDNRNTGITKALQLGYRAVIFCDSDDYYSENRVEDTLRILVSDDSVVNDFALITTREGIIVRAYLSRFLEDGENILFSGIEGKNICGFSNSAARCDSLSAVDLSAEVTAVDWFFYAQLLKKGFTCRFSNRSLTYYRQHTNNLVGVKRPTYVSLLNEVKVKAQHYRALASIWSDFGPKATDWEQLYSVLVQTPGAYDEYYGIIKTKMSDYPLWWSTTHLLPLSDLNKPHQA